MFLGIKLLRKSVVLADFGWLFFGGGGIGGGFSHGFPEGLGADGLFMDVRCGEGFFCCCGEAS